MPTLAEKRDCMGCTACEAVCPKSAITMTADGVGFKYPVVDPDLCIECKLCEKACPIVSEQPRNEAKPQKVLAGQLKNLSHLMNSQSGGAFYVVASEFIRQGGVVYGSAIVDDLDVRHIRVSEIERLPLLQKSKYVQSELGNIFKTVREDLKVGRRVMFSGTPCQIAGLRRAIPKGLSENLYCTDIICHGVPSPTIYKAYIQYLEDKYGKKIAVFNFRDKPQFGWRTPRESVTFEDGEKLSSYYYNFLFLEKDFTAREACGRCRFCTLDRVGDITIADCWGWEKLGLDTFKGNNGISLILVNTEKGQALFGNCNTAFESIEVPLEPLMQRNLQQPTARPVVADKVQRDFVNHGFEYIHIKYGYTQRNLFRYKMQRYAKAIMRRIKRFARL